MAISEQFLTGSSAAGSLNGLASLRLDIFREYPYLYEGLREDELRYLRLYNETPDAFVITVTDAGNIVGAATGVPLCHEQRELIEPFAETPYNVAEIFYVGELLFYLAYRNQGLGLNLVKQVEEHVRSLGKYRYLTCATVVRPDNHPLRPADYIPIEKFLNRTGFSPLPGVTTRFTWRETDGVSCNHPMQFWIKVL